ncbi:MAG: ATP-binding protein [Bacteroidota bacterium]
MKELVIDHQQLRSIHAFKNLTDEALEWLASKGYCRELEVDDLLFKTGEEAVNMFGLISGKVQVMADIDGKGVERPVFVITAGDINGILPYSRLKNSTATALMVKSGLVFFLHKEHFRDLSYEHPEVTQVLVEIMLDRVRIASRAQNQQTKLAALGKLSAGLAHELNNPASAIKRTSQDLYGKLAGLPIMVQKMLDNPPSAEEMQIMMTFLASKKAEHQSMSMTLMERNSLEDELVDWLEEVDVENPYEAAESFLEMGIRAEELDEIRDQLPEEKLKGMLDWLDHMMGSKRLVKDIQEASGRIADLVGTIKSYSHMDRSKAMQSVEVEEGLKSTLGILAHKFKKKQIEVDIHLADNLPPINAFPGELNQVWTNIIDNAIDAMDPGGRLLVETKKVREFVQISIVDNGPGIPEEIVTRIFEPFFTTKKQGSGTGMGLDIVKRIVDNHNGDIQVHSEPGRTEFLACFPAINA